MLIPITSSCDAAGGLPEWAIVELQGDIKRRPEATDGPDGELDIGTLRTSGPGAFQLKVGYHLLDGKQVALKKPLAVLESHTDASGTGHETAKCFKVIATVRSKLVFKTRPKPMISKPAVAITAR